MGATITYTFGSQEIASGNLQIVMIQHFSTGSGNTDHTPDACLVDVGSLNYKLSDRKIFYVDNVSLTFSDFDEYIRYTVLNTGASYDFVECIIYLDSSIVFKGIVDWTSVQFDQNKYTIEFNVLSPVAELDNYYIFNDLKNAIDGDGSATATYSSVDCFNLQKCIEHIFGLLGYSSSDIYFEVAMQFSYGGLPASGGTLVDFDEVWIKYDDFFGATPIHDFVTCTDLLINLCDALCCYCGTLGDKIYFYDISFTNTGPSLKVKNIKQNKEWDNWFKAINVINNVASTEEFSPKWGWSDVENGNNIKEIEIFISDTASGTGNMWADDGVSDAAVSNAYFTGFTGLKPYITYQIATYMVDHFSRYKNLTTINNANIDVELFDEVTPISTDFQIIENKIDYLKKSAQIKGVVT